MLSPADVLNAKCEFVNKVLAFLAKRKYSVNVCPCTMYPYYARYVKASVLNADCLDYDDECAITSAVKLNYVNTCSDTIELCSDSAVITLVETGETCTLTAGVAKEAATALTASAFPKIYLTNNSSLIGGTLWLGATRSGDCGSGATSSLIQGGCTSTDGCIDAHKSTYQFGFNSTVSMPSTAYLTSMRIYETDAYGTLGSSTNLDLDPATSVYYAASGSCPGCASILSTEVQIGDPNFQTAFATLMDNVSLALYGSTGQHGMSAIGGTNSYRIRCKAKHNPSSNWFGLHYPDARIVWSNGVTQTIINGFSNLTTSQQDFLRFYNNSITISPNGTQFDCADISPELLDQATYPSINYPASSFNKIVLLSDSAGKAIGIDQSSSCGPSVLTATYTTASTVSSVQWEDPSSVVISTTNVAVVGDPGTYTFTITFDTGCSVSAEILVN